HGIRVVKVGEPSEKRNELSPSPGFPNRATGEGGKSASNGVVELRHHNFVGEYEGQAKRRYHGVFVDQLP
ncbi:hypothetical protein U1Q18_050288, partial [Sarracenia purpurea var. burkii]